MFYSCNSIFWFFSNAFLSPSSFSTWKWGQIRQVILSPFQGLGSRWLGLPRREPKWKSILATKILSKEALMLRTIDMLGSTCCCERTTNALNVGGMKLKPSAEHVDRCPSYPVSYFPLIATLFVFFLHLLLITSTTTTTTPKKIWSLSQILGPNSIFTNLTSHLPIIKPNSLCLVLKMGWIVSPKTHVEVLIPE